MSLKLEYSRYRLPFRVPLRTAHGLWSEREGLLLRLTDMSEPPAGPTDDPGNRPRTGFGEIAPIPWFGTETVDEAEALLRELGDRVNDATLDALPGRYACTHFALHSARAKCGVRNAACGLTEPASASPLSVPHPAPSALPVAALLPAGRLALTQIAPKAELGFRTFKWKVGAGDAADELALLDDVIAALPDGARLRLDANGAWDHRTAGRWLERAADRPVEFIEQPVSPAARGADDLLLGLAGDYPTPLALDESLVGATDAARWLSLGWPGIWVIKPALLGDPAGVLAQLAAAGVAREDVVFSSALETAVGARAVLELAFAWHAGPPPGAAGAPAAAGGSTGARPAKPRALGFGIWPLFTGAHRDCDGLGELPFVRPRDPERLDAQAAWDHLQRPA
ncbi:o-succinylbenzoic acid synthetase [Opitutaceae bacterium TAV1]|nr:o-succinylbenzoic acid synthetase [Opitutaceae bacterium TAV1]